VIAVSAGIAAVVVLAGCSNGSSGGNSATPPAPTATVTVTATPSPSTSSTASPTASASPSAPAAPACRTTHLKLSLGGGQGAAGSTYQPIVFTNTGSKTCSLFGYPGVSFLDASGNQLGVPAAHQSGSDQVVNLAGNGGTASALLRLPDPGVFSPANCRQATASQLKVYPPNQTSSLVVADPAMICTTKHGRSSVRPVVAGESGE